MATCAILESKFNCSKSLDNSTFYRAFVAFVEEAFYLNLGSKQNWEHGNAKFRKPTWPCQSINHTNLLPHQIHHMYISLSLFFEIVPVYLASMQYLWFFVTQNHSRRPFEIRDTTSKCIKPSKASWTSPLWAKKVQYNMRYLCRKNKIKYGTWKNIYIYIYGREMTGLRLFYGTVKFIGYTSRSCSALYSVSCM